MTTRFFCYQLVALAYWALTIIAFVEHPKRTSFYVGCATVFVVQLLSTFPIEENWALKTAQTKRKLLLDSVLAAAPIPFVLMLVLSRFGSQLQETIGSPLVLAFLVALHFICFLGVIRMSTKSDQSRGE